MLLPAPPLEEPEPLEPLLEPEPIEPLEPDPMEPLEPEPIEPPLEPEPSEPPPVVLPEPLEPEPAEPVEPDPLVLSELLPYWRTQSSRSEPVLPTHWLGVAEVPVEPLALEPVLPVAPAPVEPLEPELPVALGLDEEPPMPPLLLPEDCAHDTLASPTSAAATAALSVFAITMMLLGLSWGDCSRRACKRDAAPGI